MVLRFFHEARGTLKQAGFALGFAFIFWSAGMLFPVLIVVLFIGWEWTGFIEGHPGTWFVSCALLTPALLFLARHSLQLEATIDTLATDRQRLLDAVRAQSSDRVGAEPMLPFTTEDL